MLKITLIVVVSIIILLLVISTLANATFDYKINNEIEEFLESQKNIASTTAIRDEDLEGLPKPVQRWLNTAGVIDAKRIHTSRSKQTALVRLDKNSDKWMELEADQYVTVDKPGFLWKAKFKVAPFVNIVGRDLYSDGKGHMLIKFQSLFTIADEKGYEIDQGTLVRYLAEIVWVPTAALEDYITWEEIDEHSAKATMTYEDVSASGIFTFDDEGNVIHFIADRYGDFDGEFIMQPWTISMEDHQVLGGFKMPVNAQITWKLDSGDYTWYKLEVQEMEYNKPQSY